MRHPRLHRLATLAGLVTAFAVLTGGTAAAHEERESQFPDGTGAVPTYREFPAADRSVVCTPESKSLIAAMPAGATKTRNLQLLPECEFYLIQDAINAVDAANSTIYLLPGTYTEDKYANSKPEGYCAELGTNSDSPLGDATNYVGSIAPPATVEDAADEGLPLAISYADQVRCPHNLNMIAILGDRTPDDDSIACDSKWCGLQIEGTGAKPEDAVIDGRFKKLNALRADRAGGVYLRNFTVQQAEFNAVYALETDGFVMDRIVARANDEYGILAFASDHGVIKHTDTYYNGDSGVYPGSASDVNKDNTEFDPTRYSIEIFENDMHENALGYSGTAGNSVYAHHNRIHHNLLGMATDSIFPGHPGMPQDHARWSDNEIYSNNRNYYAEYVQGEDPICDKPMPERGYLDGVVCPVIPMPVGVGALIAGGNYNLIKDNHFYDNWRFGAMQFWVPAPLRDEYDPSKLYDTSNHNRWVGNTMGITPDGSKAPNGLDFWWDDQGVGNCWEGNTAADGNPTTNFTLPVPSCEQGGSVFVPGTSVVKDAGFISCIQYDRSDPTWRNPPGCDWMTSPTKPGEPDPDSALGLIGLNGALLLAPALLAARSRRGKR